MHVVSHSVYVVSNSVIVVSHSVYVLSHSVYVLSHSVYVLSHSVYVVSHSVYVVSNSVYVVSNSVYAVSHSVYAVSYIIHYTWKGLEVLSSIHMRPYSTSVFSISKSFSLMSDDVLNICEDACIYYSFSIYFCFYFLLSNDAYNYHVFLKSINYIYKKIYIYI